jgi:hypothetical protein
LKKPQAIIEKYLILCKLLDHAKKLEFIPEILKTDIKSETPIFADVYYILRAENDRHQIKFFSSIISFRNYNTDGDKGKLFLEYYCYLDKNTRNLIIDI